MNKAVALVLAILIGAAGYWAGQGFPLPARDATPTAAPAPAAKAPAADAGRRIVYYRNPMGLPDTSPVPKKDQMGMDYIPVYADELMGEQPAPASAAKERRILYYRNPMGLPDTSPVPKKDQMGMDYIPVYEDEAVAATTGPAALNIASDKVQKLGVRTETVERRTLNRTVRAVGSVQVSEHGLHVVAPKFEGWIESLAVDTTGQAVKRGQALMEIYSPELVLAQQEYLVAWRAQQQFAEADGEARKATAVLAEGALQRLANFDISADQLARLRREGNARRTLTLRAPADGVVLEKMAVQGMRFMAGETLYRIANLSTVWLIAEVFEQDLGLVREGQSVTVAVNAYPGRTFTGKVDFIYPTLNTQTRTARVRVVLPNPDGVLRPALYATVQFASPVDGGPVVAVPDSAVIDSGTRQVVLVERREGSYEPRQVKLGIRADGYVQVLDGLVGGERVVVRANFLIDAESNLRAALGAFSQADMEKQAP